MLTSVDPYPWELFRGGYPGLDELIDRRVQDVPLATFEALEADDILFIDFEPRHPQRERRPFRVPGGIASTSSQVSRPRSRRLAAKALSESVFR